MTSPQHPPVSCSFVQPDAVEHGASSGVVHEVTYDSLVIGTLVEGRIPVSFRKDNKTVVRVWVDVSNINGFCVNAAGKIPVRMDAEVKSMNVENSVYSIGASK